MKKYLIWLLLALGSACFAQSGPFAPSGGSQSLTLNVAGGIAAISTTPTVIAAKTVPLVANTTNYVYVDLSAGVITSNTSGFSATNYPVATAITNAIQVITFQDVRPGAFNVTGSSGGAGTVTSVGQTVNGGASSGIFAVTGSPITGAGTLNIGITGTSGGLPFFSSGTALSSSGALPVGDFVLGGGAGAAPTATFSIVPSANGGTGINNSATLTLGTSSQNWAALGTGIVKNTTTTGALTDAASSDVISLWTGTCSSSTWLNGAGACTTPSGGLPTGLAFASPTLTISSATNGNGALALSGNTSGTATFTAPAVAGTANNPVAMSNAITGPDTTTATAPTYGFADSSTTGMFEQSAGILAFNAGSINFYTGGASPIEKVAISAGGNFVVSSPGGHYTSSGTGNDRIGTCTMSAGACTAITFTTAYTSAPACQVTWSGSGTLTGLLSYNSTTTGLQPKSSVNTDTAVVAWLCFGNAF